MPGKRMFSRDVIDTDGFLDLPAQAKALYFGLGLWGDDDGFISSPRRIMRDFGCSDADMEALVNAGFIIRFDSGVVCVAHWLLHNTLRNDRFHETVCQQEKAMLVVDERTKTYQRLPDGCRMVASLETEHNTTEPSVTEPSLTERNAAEESETERSETHGDTTHATDSELTIDEIQAIRKLCPDSYSRVIADAKKQKIEKHLSSSVFEIARDIAFFRGGTK